MNATASAISKSIPGKCRGHPFYQYCANCATILLAAAGRGQRSALSLPQFFARKSLECLHIFCGGARDDVAGELRGRRALGPVERLEIIAHELFVEARRAFADDVLIGRPEPR